MPEERLTLEHKDLVQSALKSAGVPLSEYSFTNLYLFRDVHKYTVVTGDHCPYIKGVTRDGLTYAMPLCNLSQIDPGRAHKAAETVGMIFPVTEQDLVRFDPGIFEWSYNIDDSDYLFSIEKMATYPGRHLHKKRNLMKQFMELYSWTAEDLDAARVKDALFILEQWQKSTG
ncbi:MAG: phosphatidylglycerol lysyltransferase domain-containing protein, partial [Spirochaetota bacterium]